MFKELILGVIMIRKGIIYIIFFNFQPCMTEKNILETVMSKSQV